MRCKSNSYILQKLKIFVIYLKKGFTPFQRKLYNNSNSPKCKGVFFDVTPKNITHNFKLFEPLVHTFLPTSSPVSGLLHVIVIKNISKLRNQTFYRVFTRIPIIAFHDFIVWKLLSQCRSKNFQIVAGTGWEGSVQPAISPVFMHNPTSYRRAGFLNLQL